MKTIPFRQIVKEDPGGLIPVDLSRLIRRKAGEERRSVSSVLTEIVARGLGLDPGTYGLPSSQASEECTR